MMIEPLKGNNLLQLIQESKQKFNQINEIQDNKFRNTTQMNDKSMINNSNTRINNNNNINQSIRHLSPQLNNTSFRQLSPQIIHETNNLQSQFISQRKLEQNIEEIKDINRQLSLIDEKILMQNKLHADFQESHAKFIRDNDFTVKKIQEDIQNLVEKSYDIGSKLGVQDQKIKNCEEHIKIIKGETESKFQSLMKQQQEYNKKLAGISEKISLVIENSNVFGQNKDDNNNELKMSFDSKLQYYLEEMKNKYKSFSENIIQENLLRDDQLNKMKEQMFIIANIEEDFVRTLGYLKDLSDQLRDVKMDMNKQQKRIDELEIQDIKRKEEIEDLKQVVRKVHQRMKKQFE